MHCGEELEEGEVDPQAVKVYAKSSLCQVCKEKTSSISRKLHLSRMSRQLLQSTVFRAPQKKRALLRSSFDNETCEEKGFQRQNHH